MHTIPSRCKCFMRDLCEEVKKSEAMRWRVRAGANISHVFFPSSSVLFLHFLFAMAQHRFICECTMIVKCLYIYSISEYMFATTERWGQSLFYPKHRTETAQMQSYRSKYSKRLYRRICVCICIWLCGCHTGRINNT